ncbi:MAG: LamG domain-containing protein, partial [Thermodesulfovibrionales bacterium]
MGHRKNFIPAFFVLLILLTPVVFVQQSFAASCAPAPSGLVSWWGGDNNALDMAGTNHGTLANGATYTAGMVGQAFSMDGADDYVLIADPIPASLQIQNEISLDAWIYVAEYPDPTTPMVAQIVGSQYDATIAGVALFLDGRANPEGQPSPPGHIGLQIGGAGSWHVAAANAQVPLNQWIHVAATRKANEDAKIYYNGVLQPSTSVPWAGSINYSGAWFAIGQQKDINRPFKGLIDEVEIFNRALTSDEIAAIYNAGSTGICRSCALPPSGMVSWWGGDNNALDMVGTNNGSLQNGAIFAPGKVGQAFSFDGTDDYVLIGDPVPAALQVQNEITLEAWIYAIQYPDVDTLGLIAGSQRDANMAGASIFFDGRINPNGQPALAGHIHFQIGSGLSWHTSHTQTQVPLNQWIHIVATRKANEDAKVYYNGVPQPLTSVPWAGSVSYNGAWFAIGQQKDVNRPFKGLIDEVAVYGRALTDGEIATIYNAGSAGICAIDRTPVDFPFTPVSGVQPNSPQQTSFTVSGINFVIPISITGGQYAIGGCGGVFTADPGTVNNGDIVCVQVTPSMTAGGTASADLTIGSVTSTFTATTLQYYARVRPGPKNYSVSLADAYT